MRFNDRTELGPDIGAVKLEIDHSLAQQAVRIVEISGLSLKSRGSRRSVFQPEACFKPGGGVGIFGAGSGGGESFDGRRAANRATSVISAI